jgi:predicted AAA+ superfamily ATPase
MLTVCRTTSAATVTFGEPTLILPTLEGTVLIDEAQRRKDLFPILRVLVDQDPQPGRFLVLGSASPELAGLASESLAGRVSLVELGGFGLADVGAAEIDALWLRGGLPPSLLAPDDGTSAAWRDDYISTFLERDLANLGFHLPANAMRRFWTMLAHYHGQTWNGAELARASGASESTVRRYLDALTDALVVRQLQPWFANAWSRVLPP